MLLCHNFFVFNIIIQRYCQEDQESWNQDYKEHLNISEIKNFHFERFVGEHF